MNERIKELAEQAKNMRVILYQNASITDIVWSKMNMNCGSNKSLLS